MSQSLFMSRSLFLFVLIAALAFVVYLLVDDRRRRPRPPFFRSSSGSGSPPRPSLAKVWGEIATMSSPSPSIARVLGEVATISVSQWMVNQCKLVNPFLTIEQELQLRSTFSQMLKSWREGRCVSPVIPSLIALFAPDASVARDLSNVLSRHLGRSGGSEPMVAGPHKNTDSKGDLYATLQARGCSQLSPDHSLETLRLLEKQMDSNPTCPITLEALVQGKTLSPDVAMLRQEHHVFLYRKEAVEKWFQHAKTNPMTREQVDPDRQLFTVS